MRTTARNATTTSTSKTGPLALLGSLLHIQGTGAPKITKKTGASMRLLLATAATMLGALAFSAAPALAAAPEKPEVSVADSTAVVATPSTEAVLRGVLNPAATAPSEAGTYRFLYKKSKTECTGESKAPASPGMALGIEHEEVSETLTGLAPDTEYTVCLADRDGEGETLSSPVTFKTALPPEKPVTVSPAKLITATSAKLEGTLNPVKAGEAGTYEFTYQRSTTECNREFGAPEPAGTMTGTAKQGVSATVTNLEPNQTYTFCLVAINKAGELIAGNAVTFKTSVSKPSVIGESAEPKAEEARLNATVNPSNEPTECHFEYGETSVSEHVVECEQGNALEGGEQGVAVTVTGLKQNTPYHYRVLVKNATGEEKGTEETFTTAIRPEAPTGLKAEATAATTATLTGVLNPKAAGNPGSYEFLYKASTKECEGGEASGGSALGGKEEAVKAELTGLDPNTTYTVCLRAHNEVGEETTSAPVTFTTPVAAPVIESEASSNVEASEARLEATINPGNSPTSYHFEYGTTAGRYEHATPAAEIPAKLTGAAVNTVVTGLTPSTTYHYRVVASNALPGDVDGPDQTFTTLASAPGSNTPGSCPNEARRDEQSFGKNLPDCRAYELVSPQDTNGQDAVSTYAFAPRAAESGNAIAYDSKASYGASQGAGYFDLYISRRGPEGWGTENVSPLAYPKSKLEQSPDNTDAFTPELTAAIIKTSAALTPEAPAPEEDSFRLYRHQFGSATYDYLGEGQLPLGESTSLEDVVYGDSGTATEWFDGRRVPVTVNNTPEALSGAIGSQVENPGSDIENEGFDTWHAVSAEGSRVIFTSPAGWEEDNIEGQKLTPSGTLYQRINTSEEQSQMSGERCIEPEKACTIDVSASQKTNGSGPGGTDPLGPKPVRYWAASTNGSRIFFTSTQELTNDAYTGPEDNAANLYEYEAGEPGQPGTLKDLSVDDSGEGAAVGGVVQVSEDGSYVYFAAGGVLASNTNSQGAKATPEPCELPTIHEPLSDTACNLYVYKSGETEPRFIATLGANDLADWAAGKAPEARNELQTTEAGPAINAAAVSPDSPAGSTLAFVSEEPLTTYDTDPAAPGDCNGRCSEVYLYQASTGALVCASCNPSGARPVGPAAIPGGSAAGQHRPRSVLADGAVFFDSSDALAGAAGGVENVFEFEDGRIYPISDVAGGQPSKFLDAGANGEDVFFASPNRLLPQAQGEVQAVYDARVDGGFPLPVAPQPCKSTETCAPGATAPPVAGAAASESYEGPGNPATQPPAVVKPAVKPKTLTRVQKLAAALKVCKRDKKKAKRKSCEASAQKKYGAKKKAKAKKSDQTSYDRRAHS